jgi:hypothetical protein
LLPLS